jgi:hypothetical protein
MAKYIIIKHQKKRLFVSGAAVKRTTEDTQETACM